MCAPELTANYPTALSCIISCSVRWKIELCVNPRKHVGVVVVGARERVGVAAVGAREHVGVVGARKGLVPQAALEVKR